MEILLECQNCSQFFCQFNFENFKVVGRIASDFSDCKVALRQGDIFPSLLSTILISELVPYLRTNSNGLTLLKLKNFIKGNLGAQRTETLMNLPVLLYTDDFEYTEIETDKQKGWTLYLSTMGLRI